MAHVERIAATGIVHVVAGIVGDQAVVRGVVDAPQRKRGTEMVTFAGVVVNDVQDHFNSRAMQGVNHLPKVPHRLAIFAARCVPYLGGKVAQRIVTPVVAQAFLHEVTVVEEVVGGHQLHRRDTERLQVIDGRFSSQPQISSSQRLGDFRMKLGKTAHVELVDDRLVPRRARQTIVTPGKRRIDDHGQGSEGRVAPIVEREILRGITNAIAKHGVGPRQVAADGLRIRIQNDFVGVKAMAFVGRVRPVDTIAVELPRRNIGQVAVPDLVGVFGKRNARGSAGSLGGTVEAQLYSGSILGK